jgi:hypothetical protein
VPAVANRFFVWFAAISYKDPNCAEFYAIRGYVVHCLGQFKEASDDFA